MKQTYLLAFLLTATPLAADIAYEVHFKGVEGTETEELLHSASQLITLQDCPPTTPTALQRRAEAEIPRLVQALHSQAFFDAEVDLAIDFDQDPAIVNFEVVLGPVYALVEFVILSSSEIGQKALVIGKEDRLVDEDGDLLSKDLLSDDQSLPGELEPVAAPEATPTTADRFSAYDTINLEDLGIQLGDPALPQSILDAEAALISYLDDLGYPFAESVKREVIADQRDKTVSVWLYVESGPLAYFGSATVDGLKRTRLEFIQRKIAWFEGDTYDPCLIQQTFDALDASGLFVNIQITPGECQEGDNHLPIEIEVSEGRQRSVGFGASYATQQGGGVLAEWEHRNVRGMGERISLKTELMQRLQSGSATYAIPDFLEQRQELITRGEVQRDETLGFTDTSFTVSSRVNRRYSNTLLLSGGLALKYLKSSDSDNNRPFTLAKAPLQLLYNNTGSPLDPIQGVSFNLKLTPTWGLSKTDLNYYIATLDVAAYYPMNPSERTVLAAKINLGSILGAARVSVPPPERFYAGSQQLLRGYRWMTVSPLNPDNKPIGGRSLAIFSLELRQRIGENWGTALFYDVGNVYAATTPDLGEKQLQALGLGVRYYTPVGPLRLDVAFPLDRRSIDSPFQIYFSIGQAF